MKKYIISISSAFACIFLAFNANAQSNAARPIWVLGHACNSEQCLIDALADGANGIEIDVHSDDAHKNTDWSVNHGGKKKIGYVWESEGYIPVDVRASRNKSEGREGKKTKWVSLEEYLNFADMDKIAFLWLDIKTNDYATELVEHVHKILEKRFNGKDNIPFSILYGLYDKKYLTINVKDNATGTSIAALEWYKKYLWPNEGIGLAREGSTRMTYYTATLTDLKKIYDKYQFPVGKHIMTNGFGWPYFPCFFWKSQISNTLIEAKELRNSGQYCVRTGTWTMERPWHGVQMVISQSDSKYWSYRSECDLILIECRNEFFPAENNLPGFNKNSLRDYVKWFFSPNGCWWKYNNGNYRRAGQRKEDPFYK